MVARHPDRHYRLRDANLVKHQGGVSAPHTYNTCSSQRERPRPTLRPFAARESCCRFFSCDSGSAQKSPVSSELHCGPRDSRVLSKFRCARPAHVLRRMIRRPSGLLCHGLPSGHLSLLTDNLKAPVKKPLAEHLTSSASGTRVKRGPAFQTHANPLASGPKQYH